MTVAARSAKEATVAANRGSVDLREHGQVRAGAFTYEGADLDTGWHSHPLHQVEYAFEGVGEVETATVRYLLPPQQAVWIPAGVSHRTTLRQVRSVSVFFEPAMVPTASTDVRILAAAPVVREMLVYAARWPIERASTDPVGDAYFTALAVLVADWLDHAAPLYLPTSTDPLVAAVMAYTDEHLATVTVEDVCRDVGVSPRTLRRQFGEVTGMTWRRYRLESRLLRAMAALAERHDSVLDVATSVGFDSVSAFTRAFFRYAGETPTAYRRRVTAD